MDQIILGIEAGGTRTTLILADPQGVLIGQRVLGPGNFRVIGMDGLDALFQECGRIAPNPVSIGIGMAGVRDARDRKRVREAAQKIWPDALIWVDHDLASALIVAQRHYRDVKAHVLVLSGTGSCCFGRAIDGAEAKCGGWGHQIGDRGSAYDIAHTAIRDVIEACDRTGQWSPLGEQLLHSSMHNDPNDWIQWFQVAEKSEIAALAVPVMEAWVDGDSIAKEVVYKAANALVADAYACWKRLKTKECCFVLAGGMFLKQPAFSRLFKRLLKKKKQDAQVSAMPVESVWGTVYAGLDLYASSKADKNFDHKPNKFQIGDALRDHALPTSTGMSSTEQRLQSSMKLDVMSCSKAFDLFLIEEANISTAIRMEKKKILQWISWVMEGFRKGGRLFYAGAGTSGRLGVLDASECPPTFGVPSTMVQGIIAGGRTALWDPAEGAEDDFDAGWRSLLHRGFRSGDLVLGIAASGRTPFVHGALSFAREMGARQGLLCFNPHLKWSRTHRPDVVICPEVGPEILTGSTRLKAGTATKLILNMITTLSMVGIGKVKSNLMIDVQTTNNKLRDRAVRIVVALTGTDYDSAHSTLVKSAWDISKTCLILEGKGKPQKV